jgi:hypothetical protein
MCVVFVSIFDWLLLKTDYLLFFLIKGKAPAGSLKKIVAAKQIGRNRAGSRYQPLQLFRKNIIKLNCSEIDRG